jgi:ATP-dependent Lon protease
MSQQIIKNEFFDINKFPAEKGLLIFPISMSRIATGQSPQECLGNLQHFSPSKISKPLVGVNFIYTSFLYFNLEANLELKKTYLNEMIKHQDGMKKLLNKHHLDFQIQHSFNYQTWAQLYLDSNQFRNRFLEIKEIYNSDIKFQKLLKEDCQWINKEHDEQQVDFFLEEHLLVYLMTKGETRLQNDYIQD